MQIPGKNTRGAMVPVAIAVVVAVLGTAAIFVLEIGVKNDVAGNGISMITSAAADRAGATARPTAANVVSDLPR